MWRRQLRAWWLPVVLVLAYALGIPWLHAHPVGIPPWPGSDRALLFAIEGDPQGAPPTGASGIPVALPHVWLADDRVGSAAWYRFDVGPLDTGAALALYAPQSVTIDALWLNGAPLPGRRRLGDSTGDIASTRPPQLLALPHAHLTPDANVLWVRIVSSHFKGYMGPIWVAPHAELAPLQEHRYFVEVTSVRFVFVATVAFALFLLASYGLRRDDPATLWLAIVCLAVVFGSWNVVTLELPVPHPETTWIGNGVLVAMMVSVCHRLLRLSRPRIEAAAWALAAFDGVLRFALPTGEMGQTATALYMIPPGLAGFYPVGVILHANATRSDPEVRFMTAAALVFLLGAFHDLAWLVGAVPRTHSLALHWALGGSVVLFGWVFVRRFISALERSETLGRELEERVRAREAELAGNYARLAQLERDRAVSEERTRMMEEIHDGMGGRIASTLAELEGGAASPASLAHGLRGAMQDMRLLVHSLDPYTADLPSLLGLLRDDLEQRLGAAEVQLEWRVGDTPAPRGFGPESALHVARIVQQAVTNVVEHAKAGRVTVRTEVEGVGAARRVVVAVEDDGLGLPERVKPAQPGRGRGFANMGRRARRIGGELYVRRLEPGTSVELRLPVEGG